MLKSMINPDLSGRTRLFKGLILLLGISLFFSSLVFAGPNENAGITFDLNATTYGNQNLLQIPEPNAGNYIRLDVYAQDVVNLDTYEFEVIYNTTRLQYITAVPTNPITYEENILTTNGGTALGWMIDTSIPGVLSIAYTLAGSDTTQAPEGEGLIADIVFQALTTGNSYLSFGSVYYHDSSGTMDEITSTVISFLGGVPPMPPADLTAYSDSTTPQSIQLTWINPTENADGTPLDDLAGINVYYADGTFITSVAPGVETYAVSGLIPGQYYSFYVTAYDNETPVNESIPGNTAGAIVIAPMPPSDLTAYSDYTTPNSIQLFWTDPTENIDGSLLTNLNHIEVYYSDGTFIASVNPGIETYIDNGLTDGQLYSYYLIAVTDDSTASNPSCTISWYAGGSPIPSPPQNLFADAISNGIIQLTWNDPNTQFDGTPLDDLAGINVYFADSTLIASVDPGIETYTVSGLIPGQYYSFYVTACDNETPVNESEPSNTAGCYASTLWYVHPDSTLNSIQAAIDLCSYGDTVLVAPGTYVENINFIGKNITVGSLFLTTGDTTYISQTIIDGNQNGHVVEFSSGEDSTAILTGFTITNGSSNDGGGIYCRNHSSPSLSYLTITGNTATRNGGGICCWPSSPGIKNVTISGNYANWDGGGIYLRSGSHPIIENVTITGNYAGDDGGGIECRDCCSPSIENVTITGNTAASAGGGMTILYGSAPSITNVIISGNTSGCFVIGGGGIWFGESGNAILTNVIITGNNALWFGGGIDCAGSSPSITNVTISGNNLYGIGGEGNGIRCMKTPDGTPSNPSLINCIVSDNTGGDYGICVSYGISNPSINYSNFWNNEGGNFYDCDELIGVNVTTNANGDSCDVYYNIQLDPLFFDPENGDVHLTAYSPCIDAGTPDTTGLHLPEYDLDGNPRIYNGIYDPVEIPKIIDMGVYEEWRQYGSIEGYVTELDGGAPIEGAEITFVQYTGFTNGDGYYIIDSLLISELVGIYIFSCHAEGYNDTLTEGVEIQFNYTSTCNFEMTAPYMEIYPASIDTSIAPGEVLTTYITVSNNGNGPLNYTVSVVQNNRQNIPLHRSRYTGKTQVTKKNVKPENRITGESTKVEFSVSPEYLSRKSCNNSAVIESNVSGWYSVPNKSGDTNGRFDEWYSYGDINALWWVVWAPPERVTYFNPADFGITGAYDIKRISHWFYEHQDYPWDDATFHFKIYDEDGVTLLYESEDIEAQHMVEIVHELTTPVTITSGGFYFGVAPVSTSGFPSTCADNLYTGDNHSYFGSPGNWTLWSEPPDCGEFIQGIYLTTHPWMAVEPMAGTIEPGCVDMVAVTFDATYLDAGTIKTADIVFTSFDPDVGWVSIPVQLEVTDVGFDDIPVTLSTKLNPNFPNPFNPYTTISFSVTQNAMSGSDGSSFVNLEIYNIKGQKVKTLINEKINAGTHQFVWNGKDESGNPVSSGIYFYKMDCGDYTSVKKMLLLR